MHELACAHRACRARHVGRFVSARSAEPGRSGAGERRPRRGAFRKTLVSCSSCARMSTSHSRGHAASLHQSALLHAAKRGDQRATEELLRRYEPLIGAVVARLRLPCGCERSDIAQEARIGLVRAIWAWRPERGPFGAFASSCARDQAIKAIDTAGARKHQLLSRAVSLHSVLARSRRQRTSARRRVASPLDERLTETRPLADPVRTVLAREQIDEIRAALATLTARSAPRSPGTSTASRNSSSPASRARPRRRSTDRCAGPATSSARARSGSRRNPARRRRGCGLARRLRQRERSGMRRSVQPSAPGARQG